jgi:biotin carboxyl carrier protein
MQYEVEVNGRVRQVNVHRSDGQFVVSLDGVDRFVDAARVDQHTLSLLIAETADGPGGGVDDRSTADFAAGARVASRELTLTTDAASGRTAIAVGGVPLMVALNGRRRRNRSDDGVRAAGGPQRLVAPMPGKVLRVLVTVGQAVTERQPVVVVEAMKMENELRAAAAGVVAELHVSEGQSVDAGTLLLVLGPA